MSQNHVTRWGRNETKERQRGISYSARWYQDREPSCNANGYEHGRDTGCHTSEVKVVKGGRGVVDTK
eukprot:5033827-Amphidinium_carterae.3